MHSVKSGFWIACSLFQIHSELYQLQSEWLLILVSSHPHQVLKYYDTLVSLKYLADKVTQQFGYASLNETRVPDFQMKKEV